MTIYRSGKYQINTDTAIEFDTGSTGSLGHYSSQGKRDGYCCTHRDGSITILEIGSGYYPSALGSGLDWERDGHKIFTASSSDIEDGYGGVPTAAMEALVNAGKISAVGHE